MQLWAPEKLWASNPLAVVMVVVMTGSPKVSSYPGPSAQVWASRVVEERTKSAERTKAFGDLKSHVMTKQEVERQAKKEAKAIAEAKYKADAEKRKAKEDAERAQRASVRHKSLEEIKRQAYKAAEEMHQMEQTKHDMARLRIKEQNSGMLYEDQIEAVLDAGDVQLQANVAKAALEQRKRQEELDAKHEAEAKADREAKAQAKEAAETKRRQEEAKKQRDDDYRIKKEMALETKRQKERLEADDAKVKKIRQAQRKKNDEYDKWLGKGDILRDEMELMNERREGSSMSKGAKFSGIPDTKVDGKGNQ